MTDTKPLGWIKADKEVLEHAIKVEGGNATPEAEQGGVVIIPPLLTDKERNAYPEDYIAYCREREKKRKKLQEQGVDIEAPDFPEELMKQAEEASRAFNAQAEEATKAMEAHLRGEGTL